MASDSTGPTFKDLVELMSSAGAEGQMKIKESNQEFHLEYIYIYIYIYMYTYTHTHTHVHGTTETLWKFNKDRGQRP